jgi:hypothetical protein
VTEAERTRLNFELKQAETASVKAEGRAKLFLSRLASRCPELDPSIAKALLLSFDFDLDQAATIQQSQTALSLLLVPVQNVLLVNTIDDVPRVMNMPQSDNFDVRIWPLDSIRANRNSVLVSQACKVRDHVQLHVIVQQCSAGLKFLDHCAAICRHWQQTDMATCLFQAAPGVLIDPLTLITYSATLEPAILRMLGNTVIAADDSAAAAAVQRCVLHSRARTLPALRDHK